MAIQINDNIYVRAGKPIDFKYGPYLSVNDANLTIPIEERYNGLTFGVYDEPDNIQESDISLYYYYGNLTDSYVKLFESFIHPIYTPYNLILSGATVLNSIVTDDIGSVLSATTRTLTTTDINAVPTSRILSISGTTNQIIVSNPGTQDLSTDRNWILSLPQDIHALATPTFADLTINGNIGLRATATETPATQIPIFTSNPQSTTRILVTRTPSQLLNDMSGLPLSGGTMTGFITLHSDPTQPFHAATKQYVDAVSEGLHIHPSVNVATTNTLASISGATVTYNNGTNGVGSTLSLSIPLLVIDGYTLTNGDRVLIKNESNKAHNGLYIRTSSTLFTRASDQDTAAETQSGDFVFVSNGNTNGKTGWVQIFVVNQMGVDPIDWEQFSGQGSYIGSNSIILNVNSFERAALTGDVTAPQNNNTLTIANNAVSNTKFRQSSGLSIVGRTSDTTGNIDDIVASTDNQVLRRSGTSIGFGAINLASSNAVSGILSIANGGTNSSTALNNNRIMISSTGSIVEASAITPNRAIISDNNGIPTHSVVTDTEISYLSGVTSSIQTQINAKQNAISLTTSGSSGASTLVGSTLNIPTYTLSGLGGIGGSIATGQVAFGSGTNTIGGDNGLFWDNTNKRLGIGTNSPAQSLDVNGTARVQGALTTTADASINTISVGLGAGNISSNTRVGNTSLNANTTGTNNSAFGQNTLVSNTTGINNTAIGQSALNANTGNQNTAVGTSALLNNSTGSFNSALGSAALLQNTTGSNNIGVGRDAGRYIADGTTGNVITNNSIFLGFGTRANANNETNQTVIGYQAIGLGSNTTVIGNSSTTFGRWWGNLLIGTSTNAGFALDVNGTARVQGQITISTASPIFKTVNTGGLSQAPFLSVARSDNTGSASLYLANGFGTFAFSSNLNVDGTLTANNSNFTNTANFGASGSSNIQINAFGRTVLHQDVGTNNPTLWVRQTVDGGVLNQNTGLLVDLQAQPHHNIVNFRDNNLGTPISRFLIKRSGEVLIGTSTTISSSILTLESTTQGFLPPRMTSAQRDAIASPATGLELYQSTNNAKSIYNGSAWVDVVTTSNYDGLNIAVGTSTGTKIGTATTQKLGFFNATPVTQRSGDVLTALSDLGLVASPTVNGYVPTTRTLTINGTSFDLSADRSWTIASGNIYNLDGSLTANRSLTLNNFTLDIIGSAGTSRFFANGRIGFGTTTDAGFRLDVNGTTRLNGATTIDSTLSLRASATASAATQIPVFTADPASTTRTLTTRTPAQLLSDASGISGTITTSQIAFGSGTNAISGDNGLLWNNSTKRLGINVNPERSLDVSGNARITSSLSGSTVLTVSGTSGNLFSVSDDLSGPLLEVNNPNGDNIFEVNVNGYIYTNTISLTGLTSVSSPHDLYTINNTVGDGVYFDYIVTNTTNNGKRIGTIYAVWDNVNNTIDFTDISTNDINNSTANISFTVDINSTSVILRCSISNDTFNVKISTRII